ncbi:MAG: hypothetical protein FWD98_09075 [Defluviitaleaceae bacterium]|nr:hypothetical protein [Defluviitaleaceae bacterium]
MILILSDKYDAHADVVCDKLSLSKSDFFRFNLDVTSLRKSKLTCEDGEWTLRNETAALKSSDLQAVWCRRAFVELLLEESFDEDVGFKIWKREWNSHLMGLYAHINSARWLNPLRKAYKGENKYFQMQCAREIGFNLPKYAVSNEAAAIEKFISNHGRSVIKFMNQDVYSNRGKFCGAYVNTISIDDLSEFGDEENPVFVQQYIEKSYEVRYTVVGEQHFVCKIDSQRSDTAKDDWRRYDLPNTPHSALEPPPDIRLKVERFMRLLGLSYGALDFIVTPQDTWFFLEINCMGQWLWIEELSGLAISDAIVQWLIN